MSITKSSGGISGRHYFFPSRIRDIVDPRSMAAHTLYQLFWQALGRHESPLPGNDNPAGVRLCGNTVPSSGTALLGRAGPTRCRNSALLPKQNMADDLERLRALNLAVSGDLCAVRLPTSMEASRMPVLLNWH